MQRFQVSHHNNDFVVIGTTNRSQAATMVLAPGDSEGGQENRHDNTDQWVYVIAGTGMAVVNGKQVELHPGTLLLIEAGENHELVNTGFKPLEMLDFYAPPEY